MSLWKGFGQGSEMDSAHEYFEKKVAHLKEINPSLTFSQAFNITAKAVPNPFKSSLVVRI